MLGHRRLSIIDTSAAANQPFRLGRRRRSSSILNGEIYNFRALRAELEAAGATFRTSSDTEVLLAAYRAWGADCVERFSGMFAFALWDAERSVLFCARDRAGEKPFHYLAPARLRVRLGAEGADALSRDSDERSTGRPSPTS